MVTVLQLTPALDAGGVERTTVDIAAAIVQAGGRAIVASEGGRLETELATVGAELVRLPMAAKDLRLVTNTFALAKLVRAEGVDIIHARSRAPAWSGYWAAKLTRRPFVTTYAGAYNAKTPWKRGYNSVMAKGDRVIANSLFTQTILRTEHKLPASRIDVIPRGVDTRAFDPAAVSYTRIAALRGAWGLPPGSDAAVVLLPGRLTRWKGQEVAIEAFALLRGRGGPPALLVMPGDDQGRVGYRAGLKTLADERGVADAVFMPGHCTDMPAAYALADVVLSTSIEPEAFGRVAAEAGCMGRPVIASDHGGAKETVIDGVGGRRVPPGDPVALADALEAILGLPAAQRLAMGEAAARDVRARFSIEAMQSATLAVYERLAEGRT